MKKLILIVLAALIFLPMPASAAWTIAVSKEAVAGAKSIIKVSLTSDGTALAQDIWSDITSATTFRAANILGKYIIRLKTDPDATNPPASTYAMTIIDALGDTATLSARSTTTTEFELIPDVTGTGGYLIMYGYLYITCEDIGSGNTTVLYLEMVP